MASKKGGVNPFKGIAANVHIKKNTAGTSNELSLSVLDGRKSQADASLGEADPKVKLGDLSIFTMPSKKDKLLGAVEDKTPALGLGKSQDGMRGAAKPAASKPKKQKKEKAAAASMPVSPSASARRRNERVQRDRQRALVDPEKEIKRRKKNRRIRRVVATTCACIICAGAIGAAAWYGANLYTAHQENLGVLGQAFDELEKADDLVLSMDDMVMADVPDASTAEMEEMTQAMEDAGVHLNAACAFATTASENLGEGPGFEAAAQVVKSAEARRSMMEYASEIISADQAAVASITEIDECWSLVEQADALMKEAAALVTDTTNENVQASQAKSEEATALLYQAQDCLNAVLQAYPDADFEVLSSFIAKRIEQNGYAVASDEAIYLQDKATAESYNEQYNQADADAVELAGGPAS